MWIVIFSVSSVVIALLSLAAASFAVRIARQGAELPQERLRSVESRTESLVASLNDMQVTMEVIANRVKMQRVRNTAMHAVASAGEPDSRTDPEAWRAWKNAQLRTGHGL
jgi:hypothetical protein